MSARHAARGKPLPPFGTDLRDARRRGVRPNVFVHAGRGAWERAKERATPDVLCVPPGAEAAAFDWSIVRGLSLMLIAWEMTEQDVRAIGEELIRAGAVLVMAPCMGADGQQVTLRFVPAGRAT